MFENLAFPTILFAFSASLHKDLPHNAFRQATVQIFPIDGRTVINENVLLKEHFKNI